MTADSPPVCRSGRRRFFPGPIDAGKRKRGDPARFAAFSIPRARAKRRARFGASAVREAKPPPDSRAQRCLRACEPPTAPGQCGLGWAAQCARVKPPPTDFFRRGDAARSPKQRRAFVLPIKPHLTGFEAQPPKRAERRRLFCGGFGFVRVQSRPAAQRGRPAKTPGPAWRVE